MLGPNITAWMVQEGARVTVGDSTIIGSSTDLPGTLHASLVLAAYIVILFALALWFLPPQGHRRRQGGVTGNPRQPPRYFHPTKKQDLHPPPRAGSVLQVHILPPPRKYQSTDGNTNQCAASDKCVAKSALHDSRPSPAISVPDTFCLPKPAKLVYPDPAKLVFPDSDRGSTVPPAKPRTRLTTQLIALAS